MLSPSIKPDNRLGEGIPTKAGTITWQRELINFAVNHVVFQSKGASFKISEAHLAPRQTSSMEFFTIFGNTLMPGVY